MEETNTEKLIRLISNEDPAMRGMGLAMTKGAQLSEEIFDKILAISLWDPNKDLRKQANKIVGKTDFKKVKKFPKYFEPFYDYKKEEEYNYLDELCNEEERTKILKKIIKINNNRVKPLLLDALDKESRQSWDNVEILCKVLTNYSDGNVRRKLIKLIKKSRYGESHLIHCLSKVGCGSQITDLIPLLDGKGLESGFGEDELIKYLRGQKVFSIIKKDYETSTIIKDKIINIKRMGILGDVKACKYLENILTTIDDEKIRTVAIGSLGRIAATESIEVLARLINIEKGIFMKKLMERAITKIEDKKLREIIHQERLEREKRMKKLERKRNSKGQ